MFGRLGGLAGGNMISILLENYCNTIFNGFAILSIGECGAILCVENEKNHIEMKIQMVLFSVCALVFLLIKKEIAKPAVAECATW